MAPTPVRIMLRAGVVYYIQEDMLKMLLKPDTNEEILPGYSADFPYINSCANLDSGNVLWHWHRAV